MCVATYLGSFQEGQLTLLHPNPIFTVFVALKRQKDREKWNAPAKSFIFSETFVYSTSGGLPLPFLFVKISHECQ